MGLPLMQGCENGQVCSSFAPRLELRPALPDGLAAWEKRISWRISGSLLPAKEPVWLMPGGEMVLTHDFRSEGDWVLCEAALAGEPVDAGLAMFVDLGWTSAALLGIVTWAPGQLVKLDLNRAGGCEAALLANLERAGANWRGLNLSRLHQEIARQDLDSVSLDFWRLFDALARRDVSVYDVAASETFAVDICAPAGVWLDARGNSCGGGAASAGGVISLNLPLGTSTLFSADAGAFLRITVYRGGDGQLRTSLAEHRYE